MTRTDDVLAHIDHTLDDFETGPDAMRWTPQLPPKPTSQQLAAIQVDLTPVIEVYRRAFRAIAVVFERHLETIQRAIKAFHQMQAADAEDAEDAERRRRMHHAYRQRQLARRRRNRR